MATSKIFFFALVPFIILYGCAKNCSKVDYEIDYYLNTYSINRIYYNVNKNIFVINKTEIPDYLDENTYLKLLSSICNYKLDDFKLDDFISNKNTISSTLDPKPLIKIIKRKKVVEISIFYNTSENDIYMSTQKRINAVKFYKLMDSLVVNSSKFKEAIKKNYNEKSFLY